MSSERPPINDSPSSGLDLAEIRDALPLLANNKAKRHPLRWAVVLLLIVAASVALYTFLADELTSPEGQAQLTRLGYLGIFLGTFISSASIVLPLPGAVLTLLGGALLNPLFVGLVAGVAEALAELTGYVAGMAGRNIVERNRFLTRVEGWMRRHGTVTVLVVCTIPNPIVDFIGVTAGASRFPIWRFLGAAWVGKTIKSVATAYVGAWGFDRLLDLVRSIIG